MCCTSHTCSIFLAPISNSEKDLFLLSFLFLLADDRAECGVDEEVGEDEEVAAAALKTSHTATTSA